MKQKFIIGLLFFGLCSQVVAQSFTDSNLPIVVINTDNGWDIVDEPRIPSSMKIIYRGPGERNYFGSGDPLLRLSIRNSMVLAHAYPIMYQGTMSVCLACRKNTTGY